MGRVNRQISIGFAGAGRVGTTMSYWMGQTGWHIKALFDIDNDSARQAARSVPTGVFTSLEMLASRCDCLILSLPDSAIVDACDRISEMRNPRVSHIIHTSGVLPSSVLLAAGREFTTASMHPVMSIPPLDRKHNPFKGVIFGIEGRGRASGLARNIVSTLGGRAVDILPEAKPLYHAACSLSGNNTFAVFQTALEMFEASGMDSHTAKKMVRGLVTTALDNWMEKGMAGLTGPLKRGDSSTIMEHRVAASQDDLWSGLYQSLFDNLAKQMEER